MAVVTAAVGAALVIGAGAIAAWEGPKSSRKSKKC